MKTKGVLVSPAPVQESTHSCKFSSVACGFLSPAFGIVAKATTNPVFWGNVENFDLFIQKIKDDEVKVAKLAINQFGSVEKYTEAMKYNLEHFSEMCRRFSK